MIGRMFVFFREQSFVYPADRERKHRSDGNIKSLCYLSYQLAGASLKRRAVKVEIVIAEFHRIDVSTP
jgi:hypothetical protein